MIIEILISMSNSNNFMVFAPEFHPKYPGLGDNYLMGNVFDDGDNPTENEFNEFSEWTFSVIDDIFDYIVNQVSGTQETYNAWGILEDSVFTPFAFLFQQ